MTSLTMETRSRQTIGTGTFSVPLTDLLPTQASDLYREWCEFFHQSGETTLNQHPDFVLRELLRDVRQQGWMVAHHENGKLTAVAALLPKRVESGHVGAAGWKPIFEGWRLVGVSIPATNNSAARAVLEEIDRLVEKTGADLLFIEELERDSTLHRLLESHEGSFLSYSPSGFVDHWCVELLGDAETYWKNHCSAKRRQTLRRINRKVPDAEFERITDMGQVGAFLKAAHAISKETWQSDQYGLRVEENDAEYQHLIALSREGALRCYLLRSEGEPLAFVIGHQYDGRYHYEELGYRASRSKLSPGTALLFRIIEDLFEFNQPRWLDFGFGAADYKERFGTHRTESQTLWLLRPSPRTRCALAHVRFSVWTRALVGGCLERIGLKTQVRNFLRKIRRRSD